MFATFARELGIRLRHNWRLFVAILTPIILLPVALSLEDGANPLKETDPTKKFRTAYVITLMATYWVLEVIPLAVTSLLPLVLFPLLDILDAATVSKNYMKESNMIFLGAVILALAIEYCGLHVRAALRVISIFGTHPTRIMLGTMIIAATMSMWISDTSCTTMLLPILSAITAAMFREEQDEVMSRPNEEEVDQGGPRNESSFLYQRARRESNVFANAALQGHLNSPIRRRSRRSDSSASNPYNFNSASVNSKATNKGNRPTEALDDEVSASVRNVSSMSIIMEGIAVPTEEQPYEMPDNSLEREAEEAELQRNIRKMLLFAVAYSASIGGTGSLVGTGPIKVFKELIKEYKLEKLDTRTGISFATWMGFNIPPLLVNIFIVWLFLTFRYVGCELLCDVNQKTLAQKQDVKEYLNEEYKKLGPISAHEISVAIIFFSVVLLWLFRDPQVFPGWNSLINSPGTGDSTAAMLGVILLFVLPKSWSFLRCGRGKYHPAGKYEALLDWKFVSTNAPWGYILLIGSGYAIADASQKSNLSYYIGLKLKHLGYFYHSTLLIIVMFLTSLITEVVSNTACASLILPVLFSLSCKLKIHPIYLTMASAVTASYAFMLPISSPPNAIIFATGELSIREMLVNGLFLNVICNLVLYFFILTYGDVIFDFSNFHQYSSSLQMYDNCTNFNK